MVYLQFLTASIPVAVSQAVDQELEQTLSATVQMPQEKTCEVATLVDEEVTLLTNGTQARITATALSILANKPFASIAVA